MCRRLVVAVVPVRVLLLSAKHLILAAMAAVVGVGVFPTGTIGILRALKLRGRDKEPFP